MCVHASIVAKSVEELQVFQRALAAAHEISAMLGRPAFQCDRELRCQLSSASIRVVSDISEGFEQKTDRHFAKYLYDSRGGSREVRTQLLVALGRRYISATEQTRVCGIYEEIAKMLTGLIRHLEREDRKHRR